MAATLSRQARLFPFTGTTGVSDGSGMSTRIAYELPFYLNNLHAYVNQRVTFAAGVAPGAGGGNYATPVAGYVERQLHTSSREIYMCQFPFISKPGATRLVWTCGVEGYAAGGTTEISAVTIYVSPNIYTGAGPTSAFDSTNLPASTLASRSVALTISQVGAGRTYQLANDATTGFAPPPTTFSHPAGEPDTSAVCIVTVTGSGTGVQGFARVYDLTLWNLFE